MSGDSLWDWQFYRKGSIQERFDHWMETSDGQLVYQEVLRRAQALRDRGWQHFAIGALWEAIRYDWSIKVGPEGGFKLNDHYRSRIVRVLVREHPEFAGFFEMRELRA